MEAAFNPEAPSNLKGLFTYSASKTEAEKAAWKWVKEHSPGFQFNSVLPDFTVSPLSEPQFDLKAFIDFIQQLGKILHPEIHGSVMGWVRGLTKGDTRIFQTFVPRQYTMLCWGISGCQWLSTADNQDRVLLRRQRHCLSPCGSPPRSQDRLPTPLRIRRSYQPD